MALMIFIPFVTLSALFCVVSRCLTVLTLDLYPRYSLMALLMVLGSTCQSLVNLVIEVVGFASIVFFGPATNLSFRFLSLQVLSSAL